MGYALESEPDGDGLERLLERIGRNRRAVAREGEAGLAALSVDDLAGDVDDDASEDLRIHVLPQGDRVAELLGEVLYELGAQRVDPALDPVQSVGAGLARGQGADAVGKARLEVADERGKPGLALQVGLEGRAFAGLKLVEHVQGGDIFG